MKITREQVAINAYLKFLQSKGTPTGKLYQRSLFLDKLSPNLAKKSLIRTEFSVALNLTLATASTEEKIENLSIAREFYPFWMQDFKAIAAFNASYGFDVATIQWKPLPSTLNALTKSIDSTQFDEDEIKSLHTYMLAMLENGADKSIADTRSKLAKVILLRLRDAPVENNKTYRTAVDMILPLFIHNEIKQLFLTVVREFYDHWNQSITQNKSAKPTLS
jgi:hypothetical protein